MGVITCKQVGKYRDGSGKVIGYCLIDCYGNQIQMRSEELKGKIKSHRLNVINLTFTKDGRLVEKTDSMMGTTVVNYNYGNPKMGAPAVNYNYSNPNIYQRYYQTAQPTYSSMRTNEAYQNIEKGAKVAWKGAKIVGKTAWKVTKFTVKTVYKGTKAIVKQIGKAITKGKA